MGTPNENPQDFVLASASPRRLTLLRQIGIEPARIVPADIDETPRKSELPRDYARRIASEKARFICCHEDMAGSYLLAADTVVACGRRILPKAENVTQARECLKLLSGRRHRVLTGVVLVTPGGEIKDRLVTSRVGFKNLSGEDIDTYLASEEWQGKAGGYAIQGLASAYIRWIEGSYSNVVGLPLFEVAQLLRGSNYAF